MERFSVLTLVCLLAVLPRCQAGSEDNPNHVTELSQENLEDIKAENTDEKTIDQGPETSAIFPSNAKAADSGSEPNIYMILQKLEAQEAALEETNRKLEALEATVRALEETNRKLEASKKQQMEPNSTLAEHRIYKGSHRIAFSAALATGDFGPANLFYSLVYSQVLSNIGGHYSPTTGYFTAPLRGVYYFTLSSHCWAQPQYSCGVSLYHNGNQGVSWYGYSQHNPSSGSNSAVLLLEVGDHVNVRLWPNRVISDNSNKYSTFSGFLIFPM